MILDSMPSYSGPFKVSCRDIEYTEGDQLTFKAINGMNEDTNKSSLLIKLYYPSNKSDEFNTLSNWATYPAHRYLRGLLDYAKIPTIISNPFTYIFGGNPKLGAYISDGSDILDYSSLPVAIFSHGLAGSRTFYSGIVGELASHGFIVAAIEHRDHSAAFSYANTQPCEIEYLHAPGKDGSLENKKFRMNQLEFRKVEVQRTYELLKKLNEDTLIKQHLVEPNLEDEEHQQIFKKGNWFNGLNNFKGKLNFNELYLVGHSFGGATVLEILSDNDNPYKAGVTFDPWMYAVTAETIYRPTIAITTEAFAKWKQNFDKSKLLLSKNHKEHSHLVVVQPFTNHTNQSDVPTMMDKILSFIKKSNIPANEALKDNTFAGLSFIEKFMDSRVKKDIHLELDFNFIGSDQATFIEEPF